jgi:hypothetical protein
VIVHDPDSDRYDDLPKWLQEKIDNAIDDEPATSERGQPQTSAFDADLDDDVPF